MLITEKVAASINNALLHSSLVLLNMPFTPFDTKSLIKELGIYNTLLILGSESEVNFKVTTNSFKTFLESVTEFFHLAGLNRYADYDKTVEPSFDSSYLVYMPYYDFYNTVILDSVCISQLAKEIECSKNMDTALAVYSLLLSLMQSQCKIIVLDAQDFKQQCVLHNINQEQSFRNRSPVNINFNHLGELCTTQMK